MMQLCSMKFPNTFKLFSSHLKAGSFLVESIISSQQILMNANSQIVPEMQLVIICLDHTDVNAIEAIKAMDLYDVYVS